MEVDDDSTTPIFDVIVVGGGLSGLVVARNLNGNNNKRSNEKRRRIRWKLFEASSRIGGRLQNDIDSDGQSRNIDLGGAWIWPRSQPRIVRALVDSPTLGIKTFLQPGDDYSLSDSTRIVGGAVEFAKQIHNELLATIKPDETESDAAKTQVVLESPVTTIRRNSDRTISVELETGETVQTRHVVLAAPPRIVSERISFSPDLPASKSAAMSASETWMAGVTKVALVYKGSQPFWPLVVDEGRRLLSPDYGRPAFQVYDGSPFSSSPTSSNNNDDDEKEDCDGKISVLTFFTISKLSNQSNDDKVLADECAKQMCDSFSEDAIRKVPVLDKYIQSYDDFVVKRWALEPYISHNKDPTTITPHPGPVPELAKSEWDGTLLFAGTETDQQSPGVMEGAIGAATRVTKELAQKLSLSPFE